MRILYVENNESFIKLAQREFGKSADVFDISIARSYHEARNRLETEATYDILIVDLHLPDGDGFSLLSLAREKGLAIRIIATIGPDEGEIAAALKAGADYYILKSDDYEIELSRVVERLCKNVSLSAESHGEIAAVSKSIRVLYGESVKTNSDLVEQYLRHYGPRILLDVVRSGNDVLQRLDEQDQRDVLLLDYHLVGTNVFELVKEIRERRKLDIPIIVIACQGDEEAAAQTIKIGANDCVVKAIPHLHRLPNAIERAFHCSEVARERKAAEDELHRVEMRLTEVADSLPQPLLETDIFGKVTFANRVAFEVIGATEEDFKKGAYLFDFVSPSEHGRALEGFGAILRGEKIEPRQYTVVRKDGSTIPVIVSATRISNDSKITGMRIVLIDMTEVNAIQEAVRASENRYRLLFENSADEIFILDEDGIFLQVNQVACQKLGYVREEIVGQRVTKILPDQVRGDERRRVNQILQEGEGTFESVHLRKDGSTIPVEVHSRSVMLDGRRTMLSSARDLTERKKAEAAVRESEEKFKNLVESSLVGVYIIQDLRFAYANPAMSKIFGFTQQELTEMPSIIQTIAPADRKKVLDNIRKRVEGETDSIKYRFHGVRKGGGIIEVEVMGSRTMFEGSQAIIGTLEDITERRLAEEKLRESEERYRDLFEKSIDAIYVSSPAGKMIDINPAGVGLFGFSSREDLLSIDDMTEFYENKDDREVFKRALETDGFVRDYEVRIRRRDGQRLTVLDTASNILDDNGNVVAYRGILRDITEKRRLEEQLLQSQKLESLGQLTSGIAHDFNNVLGGITGFTELALEKMEEDHPIHNYLTRIYGLADRAAKITKQLLAFARRQILMPKDLNLNELISDLLELLPRLLGEHVQTSFIPGDNLKTVRADPSQIEQVLINLAVNAGDAMPEGGSLIIETQNVFLDKSYCGSHANVQPGEYVMVSVSDTGAGIDASTLQHIFEPFFTTKEVGRGTGLGLAVVHGIIQQHGGSINVYSEIGKGTTFKSYFPVVAAVAEKLDNRARPAARFMTGNETILIVEDNEELREFMRTLLTENGYSVLTANNGEEGVSVFDQHSGQISLVITDVVMPKMSGRELREKIILKFPGEKFMFISGYPGHALNNSFVLDLHANFLQKPFTAFEFAEKVRRILDKPAT